MTNKLVEHNKSICSNTCLPVTIKGFPQCETMKDYLCNFEPIGDTAYSKGFKKCPKHCKWAEYNGELATYYDYDNDGWIVWIYEFDNELTEDYEEYLMFDIIGLIGTVGGTLGLFIGFSFFDVSSNIIHYLFSYNRN